MASRTGRPLVPARSFAIAALVLVAASAGCAANERRLSTADSTAVADTLRALVKEAYDLSKGNVVDGMMSLYPDSGRVISATGARTTTSRDSLHAAVTSFWNGVGRYMVRPTWRWEAMEVDVLGPTSAAMTAQYTVPHWTDRGAPHVIGGAWTTVWELRGGRWMIIQEHLSDLPRVLAERLEAQMSPLDSAAVAEAESAGEAHQH